MTCEAPVVRRFSPSFGLVRCIRLLKDLFHNNSYARDDQGGNIIRLNMNRIRIAAAM